MKIRPKADSEKSKNKFNHRNMGCYKLAKEMPPELKKENSKESAVQLSSTIFKISIAVSNRQTSS